MAEDPNLEHQFLDLKSEGYDDRSVLGGLSLSLRSTLFWSLGFLALIGLGAIYVYVDQRIVTAIDDWRSAREVSTLMTRVESGLARAEASEKTYVLDRDRDQADAFSEELTRVGTALDGLYQFPQSAPVRHHIATLRDGLVQYGQQFSQFVTAEEALGLSSESGISPRLQNLTDQLQKGFKDAGFANLADQVARIVREGKETLSSGSQQGVQEIRERYRTLFAFLKASSISSKLKPRLQNLLKAHETDLRSTINSRFALESERQRFGEILAYVAPSTDALAQFATDLDRATARRLDRARSFARYTIAGSSAGIFLWFIFAGLLLFRSVIGPLRAVAASAARLAAGDRGVRIPLRGNRDAVGQVARALDKWVDDLVQADMTRRELEQTRVKLEHAAQEAERKIAAAADAAKAAMRAELETPEPAPEPVPEPQPAPVPAPQSQPAHPLPPNPDTVSGAGPISSISQQLSHFSEYVTAAANDVERTEALMRALGEATAKIEILGNLVTAVRDQVNLLAFRSAARGAGSTDTQNLIPFNADGVPGFEEHRGDGGGDLIASGRLDAIRDSTERAERTLQAVRLSMDNVNAIAQDIATTASGQALEATNKLLSQSQYLQNMLDDVMAKMHPTADRPSTPQDQPGDAFRDRPGAGLPPRKA